MEGIRVGARRLLNCDCTMAKQQDRELIMHLIVSGASNSDSDKDEPVIELAASPQVWIS